MVFCTHHKFEIWFVIKYTDVTSKNLHLLNSIYLRYHVLIQGGERPRDHFQNWELDNNRTMECLISFHTYLIILSCGLCEACLGMIAGIQ
jgi:hypothetical protein